MTHEDRYGLPLSTSSHEAASAYREGVDLMLSGWTGTGETLERAIAADPDFAMPQMLLSIEMRTYPCNTASSAEAA